MKKPSQKQKNVFSYRNFLHVHLQAILHKQTNFRRKYNFNVNSVDQAEEN